MEYEEHSQTAREFLEASDREFAAGDHLQASEKLWGAASHAVMAAAAQRDWTCRTHQALRAAVERLADEAGDETLAAEFVVAETFHKNFYHDEMEPYQIAYDRPKVRRFVDRMLAYAAPSGG